MAKAAVLRLGGCHLEASVLECGALQLAFNFGVARGPALRPGSCHVELVSCSLRQQCWALLAACCRAAPFFSGMLFRDGEDNFVDAWKLQFGASFLSVQKHKQR